jgi:hypothetical protein
MKNTKSNTTQKTSATSFNMYHEALVVISLSKGTHKNVYKLATQLLFVLLEKFRQSFFDVGQPSIGGNVNLKKTQSHSSHNYIYFNIKLLGN